MSKSVLNVKLIMLCLVIALAGGLWAANTAGLVDLKEAAAAAPLVGSFFEKQDAKEPGQPEVSPVEQENIELRAALVAKEASIAALEGEKTALAEELARVKQEREELLAYKEEKERAALNAEELCAIYQEMKAEEVVRVMENLDDETVILMLTFMEKDHLGKILASMDPKRAAAISRLLLDAGKGNY